MRVSELKKLYENAVRDGKEIIIIEGKEVLVSYLKYLIEYLEGMKVEEVEFTD